MALKNNAAIFVNFTMVGLHRWPDAPDHRSYLRSEHRHTFHIKVETIVEHDDREIEFHDLTRDSMNEYVMSEIDLGEARSCEMIARYMAEALCKKFTRMFSVTVSEDGECGATVVQLP